MPYPYILFSPIISDTSISGWHRGIVTYPCHGYGHHSLKPNSPSERLLFSDAQSDGSTMTPA